MLKNRNDFSIVIVYCGPLGIDLLKTIDPSFPLVQAALADWISYSQFGFLLSRATFAELGITESSQESHIYTVQNMKGVPGKHRQERGGVLYIPLIHIQSI